MISGCDRLNVTLLLARSSFVNRRPAQRRIVLRADEFVNREVLAAFGTDTRLQADHRVTTRRAVYANHLFFM
jgi:hypothetical protein